MTQRGGIYLQNPLFTKFEPMAVAGQALGTTDATSLGA